MDNRKTGSFNLLSTVETSIELLALFLIVQQQFKIIWFDIMLSSRYLKLLH